VSAIDVAGWLRRTMPRHLEMLDGMRDRLKESLDGLGPRTIPDREWARVYALYQAGFNHLLAEERERVKLALMARLKSNGRDLTDEEFEAGIRDLGLQAVKELSTADLAQELMRRGLTLPSVPRDGDEQ
jgi:hypothetical protein